MEIAERSSRWDRLSSPLILWKARSHFWIREIAPILSVLIGLYFQIKFQDIAGPKHFIFLYPALFLGSLFGNGRSSLIATIVATLTAWYFLAIPQESFNVTEPTEIFSLSIFFLTGGILSLFVNRFLKATERSQALQQREKELELGQIQENQKSLQQIIETIPQGIWRTDPDGSADYFSQQFYDLVGYAPDEMLGWGWLQRIVKEDQPFVQKEWQRCRDLGISVSAEFRVQLSNGTSRWFLAQGNPFRDSQGRIIKYYGTWSDIHDERLSRMEAELKSDALENSLNGFDIISSEGKFLYANPAYLKMWGYESLSEVIGTSPVAHCADPSIPLQIITELKAKGECTIEFVARRKDGSTFDVMMWARLAYDALGNEIYPTTSIDVTEKKRADERLKHQTDLLRTITNNAASCLFMMNKQGYPTFMNPAAEALTGYRLDEIKDKPLHYAVHYKKPDGSHYPMEECPIDNAQAELKPLQNQEEIFTDKFGRLFPVSYSVAPLEKDGEVIGSVLEFRDISEQKKALADLQVAKEEAERASALKSAFLANMSHEIRTPLGAMIGFADLLQDPALSPEERSQYVGILTRNGQQLGHLINDILDLSKVEAGHLSLEYAETSIQKLASEVISLCSVKAAEKNLSVDLWVDDQTPVSILTDPYRLKQILANVVGNAVKFTESGHIRVKVGQMQKGDCQMIAFDIEDSGLGIPHEQTEKVFEMFVQADGSMTRRFGGTGLGLSLSRKLARALGGDLEVVQTKIGEGTTFRLTIANEVRP